MKTKYVVRFVLFSFVVLSPLVAEARAQSSAEVRTSPCEEQYPRYGAKFCEIREQTLPAPQGVLRIEGRTNGGVSVRGWDRSEMLVRARVSVWERDETQPDASAMARRTRIETSNNLIRATYTDDKEEGRTSVSYEIFLPRRSDLQLKVHNGGIAVTDVEGAIELDGVNGGVRLVRVGGDVRGGIINGGLYVELGGDAWQGAGLNVRATNGGLTLVVPENYSARIESSTNWGTLKVDLPGVEVPKNAKRFAAELGAGGATVRVVTTNGGASIKRQAAGSRTSLRRAKRHSDMESSVA